MTVNLKENDFSADIDLDATNYQPIPGEFCIYCIIVYRIIGGYATRGRRMRG